MSKLSRGRLNGQDLFLVFPYLQLGDFQTSGQLTIQWASPSAQQHWRLETAGPTARSPWSEGGVRTKKAFKVQGQTLRILKARIPLSTAGPTKYKLLHDNVEVFCGKAPKAPAKETCRIAVFGDFADGDPDCLAIAKDIEKQNPELSVLVGDVVYNHGTVSDYLRKFFPVVNADPRQKSKESIALLNKHVVVAASGNHDVDSKIALTELDKGNLGVAGFPFFWTASANGPPPRKEFVKEEIRSYAAVKAQQGGDFSVRNNYSFNWANTHWTILDSNEYMNWTNEELRKWVDDDLSQAKAKWKFVCFHHPGFNNDIKYVDDQRMRVLCDIFEKNGVDIVFSGHCHYFEAHKPLRFKAKTAIAKKRLKAKKAVSNKVDGSISVDLSFDGEKRRRADGVIYIVTGASGQLPTWDKPKEDKLTSTWFFCDWENSYTLLDIDGAKLRFRQMNSKGQSFFEFSLEK